MTRHRPAGFARTAFSAALLAASAPALAADPPLAIGSPFTMQSGDLVGNAPEVHLDGDGDGIVVDVAYDDVEFEFFPRARRFSSTGVPASGTTLITTNTLADREVRSDGNLSGAWVAAWSAVVITRIETKVVPRVRRFGSAPTGAISLPQSGTEHRKPDVALDNRGVMTACWTRFGVGTSGDIMARRVLADGTPEAEFAVNTATNLNEQDCRIAASSSGAFVVLWREENPDGTPRALKAQRFRNDGTRNGPEIKITTRTGLDAYADLEVDEQGGFAALWLDEAAGEMRLDRYGPRGKLWGPVTAVPNQVHARLAVDADGDIAVAWSEEGKALLRRFTPDGTPREDFITVATASPSEDQGEPAVAMDADGDFAIAFAKFPYLDGRIDVQRFRSTNPIDLSLSQSDSADPVARGATYSYAVNVSNLTPPAAVTGNAAVNGAIGAATNLRFDFKLANATFQSGTGTDWTCAAPAIGSPNCTYAKPLKAGAIAPPVTLTVKATTSTRVSIASDDATLVPVQIDPNTTNNREIENTVLD